MTKNSVPVDLTTLVAGEDIANDRLKVLPGGSHVVTRYNRTHLFATNGTPISYIVPAASWCYGDLVSIEGYSQWALYVRTNTSAGGVWGLRVHVEPSPTYADGIYKIFENLAIADDTMVAVASNYNSGLWLGYNLKIDMYNPNGAGETATIESATLVVLP